MFSYRFLYFLAGAALVALMAFGAYRANGPAFIAGLAQKAEAAKREAGASAITVRFETQDGWLTRHPLLGGAKALGEEARLRAAIAIAAVPGIGGVRWAGPDGHAAAAPDSAGLHCQRDVEAILRARSIRFGEASATIDAASETVLDEVGTALLPCVGSIIAITGHTDSNGDPSANLALSRARAEAVRWALTGRGIPADGLRALGKGSADPVKGLDPADPANRRIEFSVIAKMPIRPTPIDTPGPR